MPPQNPNSHDGEKQPSGDPQAQLESQPTSESAPGSGSESDVTLEVGSQFEIAVNRVAKGGASLGPAPDGRTVFVTGAIPDERLRVETTAVRKTLLEANTIEVLSASPDRVEPPCTHVGDGCGGCDWQHVAPLRQPQLRRDIVNDCLTRLGGLNDVDLRSGPTLDPNGYRTTVRAAVVNGRAAYRMRGSHDTVAIDHCVIAHPLVEELLVDGRFGTATEVVVRAGANTGERLVVVDPVVDGVELPDDVKVVGRDELAAGKRPHYHENLGGLRLQISADSFFQCRPDGAMLLAELAGDAVADADGVLLDAYCGMGLFGALAGIGRSVIGVESNASAVADATYNLGVHARVVQSDFERWQAEPVGAVIADPARVGLGKKGCARVAETGAELVALVSCDPASLARDAKLLIGHGYELDHVTVLDLFGHTSHVETVSRFRRAN